MNIRVAAFCCLTFWAAAPVLAAPTYGLQVLGQSIVGNANSKPTVLPQHINEAGIVAGGATAFDQGFNLGFQAFVTDPAAVNFRWLQQPSWQGSNTVNTQVHALNNAGQVLASSFSPSGGQTFVMSSNGTVQALPTVPGLQTPMGQTAERMNDRGLVVGGVFGAFGGSAAVWDMASGQARLLPTPGAVPGPAGPVSFSGTGARAVNNLGQVAGWAHSAFGDRAVVWDAATGAAQVLALPGSFMSATATHINDAGQVLGRATSSPFGGGAQSLFLWDPGTQSTTLLPISNLGTDGSSYGTLTLGANGMVGGTLGGGQSVFLWNPADGSTTVMGGGLSVDAWAMNDSGAIVGVAHNGWSGAPGASPALNSAMLWQDGLALDLNTVVDLPDGWRLTQATDINNRGQITGIVRTQDGEFGFVLSPEGAAASAPLMPTNTTGTLGDWTFETTVVADQPFFFDPELAIGYEYEVKSGPQVSAVLLPADIGDGVYRLWLWENGAWVDSGIDLQGGQWYHFPAPVGRFKVMGIEPAAQLDPEDPLAFVTGMVFSGSGSLLMDQRAVTAFFNDDPVIGVHSPSPLALSALALACIALGRRRPAARVRRPDCARPR